MDYKEFASKIRGKYPGTYDDLDDQTLAQKIVQKYPQYSDVTFEEKPTALGILQQTGREALAPKPGMMEAIRRSPSYAFSPQGLLEKGVDYVSSAAKSIGQKAPEILVQSPERINPFTKQPYKTGGFSPSVAKAVGKFIEYAPEAAQMITPMGAAAQASKITGTVVKVASPPVSKTAQNLAMNAIGWTKRFLSNKRNLDRARESSQILMDEKVVTAFSSPEVMAQRASDLAKTSGDEIGKFLNEVGGSATARDMWTGSSGGLFDANDAINALESLRPSSKATKNILRGGDYDSINAKIDNAINTLKAHVKAGGEKLSWDDANELKGMFQNKANWKSNKEATVLDRIIAGKFREFLDNKLEDISKSLGKTPQFERFLANKKRYAAAMSAEDPLFNRISSELGNDRIGLTDYLLVAGSIPSGNVAQAALLLGGKKFARKFGPQTGAVLLNKLRGKGSQIGTKIPLVTSTIERKTRSEEGE